MAVWNVIDKFHFSGTNTNSNAPLILPPGMSIEQKTEFLSNLDPKHQFFISMPHTNAGMDCLPSSISCYYNDIFLKGILPLHQKEPLELYPPLGNKINVF